MDSGFRPIRVGVKEEKRKRTFLLCYIYSERRVGCLKETDTLDRDETKRYGSNDSPNFEILINLKISQRLQLSFPRGLQIADQVRLGTFLPRGLATPENSRRVRCHDPWTATTAQPKRTGPAYIRHGRKADHGTMEAYTHVQG